MTPESWRTLLSQWSAEILAIESYHKHLPPEVVSSGWLGYPPATHDEITATENRLGIVLPPSYRTFLRVTNGWRITTAFINPVRSVGEVAWYRDDDPGSLAIWLDAEASARKEYDLLPEELWTGAVLQEALVISDFCEGLYLLVPRRIGADGEWPAWFFDASETDEEEHASFWELMVKKHEKFLDAEKRLPELEEQRRQHERRG
jgi:hypothetical protein